MTLILGLSRWLPLPLGSLLALPILLTTEKDTAAAMAGPGAPKRQQRGDARPAPLPLPQAVARTPLLFLSPSGSLTASDGGGCGGGGNLAAAPFKLQVVFFHK